MSRPADHIREQRPVQPAERSLGDLFSDLTQETTTLVRQEVSLAKAEMTQKAAEVGKDVGFLAAGGLVLYAGFLALLAAVIVGLGQAGLPWWVSALIVGIVVVAAGGALVWSGLNSLKHVSPVPQQTVATLREDQQWAKEQTK
jgi:precorrin-2 methylase